MRRLWIVLASAIPLAIGCGKGTKPTGQLRVGMMPKLVGISYFNACEQGARDAASELGVSLTYDGPNTDSAELQAEMVEQWIALGYDVIAVAPNDPERIAPALKKARDAGVIVVTWDADANPEASQRTNFVNQAPVDEIGAALVDIMGEGVNETGKTVIVSGSATSPNQEAWIKAMRRRLADKYPGIELLETLAPGEDQNKAREQMARVLAAHEDLVGAWGITSVSLPATAEAVRQAGKSGKVFVTGLGLPNNVREYVKDGAVPKFVLWNPVDLGYLTIHVAKKLKESKTGKLEQGTHDFGRLKGVRVEGDQVILGPPIIFDKDNIDKYDF